jgi:DNA-binding MarR family transcriptional regulator
VTKDRVDLLISQWQSERPDLDPSPMGILGRLLILSRLADSGVAAVLRPHDLTVPEFDVLAVLRRCGSPFRQPVGVLCEHTLLSSGAMTNRIDRLEQKKLISRAANPEDRRGVLVCLTPAGLALIDRVVPERLEEAHNRLAGLSPMERRQLESLLGRLLATTHKEL